MEEELKKVRINQADFIIDEETGRTGRLVVFMYRGEYDPKAILNLAVSRYVKDNPIHQFISLERDNPWVRVVIQDVNSINQKNFEPGKDAIDAQIRRR